jgi:alpha-amylase/alpha-mannosidase (GH57 family)
VERFVCIHGHFYQPPRENPWLEAVEVQDSAHPYHDWNERVTAECYGPNSASRILDGDGRITDIVSNYEKISFNFGPTLLSWMETSAPDIYRGIIEADWTSREIRSGHGNALAQVYNHIIMPLANRRDKKTEIIWGIRDFEHRFGRKPEGMWLSETAVDLETLDLLAEQSVRFVILAQHQASMIRKEGARRWTDVRGGRVDPTMAYRCVLPSGRQISIFFYDGPISRAVAFERILDRGEDFVSRIMGGFSEARQWPQILSLATDGETYGHHHHFGDMALAYALHVFESQDHIRLTNFGEYLERFPPQYQARIIEGTSWSCSHGIERWRGDCGCSSGMHPGWNQAWRAPLRDALNWLRDTTTLLFENRAGELVKDPWAARDDYVDVILDRSPENIERFLDCHGLKPLAGHERMTLLKLMEVERHALLMYTSCGWFFDDISGIETVQVLAYASRVIQLAEELFGLSLESRFLADLEEAKSNLPEFGDGASVYDRFVKPAAIGIDNVAIHYAMSSLWQDYDPRAQIYSYTVNREEYDRVEAGSAKIAVGRAFVTSEITEESDSINFCVLSLGNHFTNGGIRRSSAEGSYQAMKKEIFSAFEHADFGLLVRLMTNHFGMNNYSLLNLFRDQKRKVLNLVGAKMLEDFEARHKEMYEESRVLMAFLQESGVPLPSVFLNVAELVLTADLQREFMSERIDVEAIRNTANTLHRFGLEPASEGLEFAVRRRLESMAGDLYRQPSNLLLLKNMEDVVAAVQSIPLTVDLWAIQNTLFRMRGKIDEDTPSKLEEQDAEEWIGRFRHIADMLSFNLLALLSPGR